MNKLVLIILLIFCNLLQAQTAATLVVTGVGNTPLNAQHNALRSALEQSFGVYISSETKILNDILVKDEISAITNGKIIDFEVLNQTKIDKDDYLVTVRAKVSIEDLVSLVTNKGGDVNFKGNVFAMNVKQDQLNERAEKVVIDKLIATMVRLFKQSFDFEISTKDPIVEKKNEEGEELYSFQLEIKSYFNENLINAFKLLESTINEISMSEDDVYTYIKQKRQYYPIYIANEPAELIDPFTIETIIKKEFKKNSGILYQVIGNTIGLSRYTNGTSSFPLSLKHFKYLTKDVEDIQKTKFSYSPFPKNPDYKPYKNSYLRNESSYKKINNLLNDSLSKYIGYFDVSDGFQTIIPDGFGPYKFHLIERDLESLRRYSDGKIREYDKMNREQLIDACIKLFDHKSKLGRWWKKAEGKIWYNQRYEKVQNIYPRPNKFYDFYIERNVSHFLGNVIHRAGFINKSTDNFPSPYIEYWEYSKLLKYGITEQQKQLINTELMTASYLFSRYNPKADENDYKLKPIRVKNFIHFDNLHGGSKDDYSNNTYLQFNKLSNTTDKLVATFSFKDYKIVSEIENMKGYTAVRLHTKVE